MFMESKLKKYSVAVLGATGVVGREMVKILEERNFPVQNLKLLATEKSTGIFINFQGEQIKVEKITPQSFENVDIALFSAGKEASIKFAPFAVKNNAVVIDNSSAFRMKNNVPLIIPEVNPGEIKKHNGIIANPNCSTIQLVIALKPIYDFAGIKRIIVSTYQSVSGTGKQAINELREQSQAFLNKDKIVKKVYPHQIAFNILPHIDIFLDNGYTKEEIKMINETRKILSDNSLKITAFAARVPVFYGHAESVYIETDEYISIPGIKQLLTDFPGVKVIDDPSRFLYPLPIMIENEDDILVGRIRKDLAEENGINMWIIGNNVRKGAALNAVQIAELLILEEK
jgi:aspartate-semialdehyde dehydrogenase